MMHEIAAKQLAAGDLHFFQFEFFSYFDFVSQLDFHCLKRG